MDRQVVAFVVGAVEAETEKALCVGRWFPKAAVSERLESAEGDAVLVIEPWFVRKNRWLAYTELGEIRTRSVRLADGMRLFQGKRFRLPKPEQEDRQAKREALMDEMDRREAAGEFDGWTAREIRDEAKRLIQELG